MRRIRLPLLFAVVFLMLNPMFAFAGESMASDVAKPGVWKWGPVIDGVEPGANSIEVYARSWAPDGSTWYYLNPSDKPVGWMSSGFTKVQPASAHTVGLQVGHWRREEAASSLSTASGASGGGLTEADMNLITALSVARHLAARGGIADILPTVIPNGYKADAVLAIHADGGPPDRRGYFVDRPGQSPAQGPQSQLADAVSREYGAAVTIPNVNRSTNNSRFYYGYYNVAPSTPMALIEAGFLSNNTDRAIMIDRSEGIGAAIAEGIMKFLNRKAGYMAWGPSLAVASSTGEDNPKDSS